MEHYYKLQLKELQLRKLTRQQYKEASSYLRLCRRRQKQFEGAFVGADWASFWVDVGMYGQAIMEVQGQK